MAKKQAFEFFFNQLVKGYRSIMGKDPEGLDLIKVKQEARQKFIEQDKIIEFPQPRSFGQEVDEMIKKGEVNLGEAPKTKSYTPSKSQTDFEIQERLNSDNKKAIKAFEERMKNKPLDPDDVLPNYNETPGEFARRNTPGSKENLLQELKIAYEKDFNKLRGDETVEELQGILKKLDIDGEPFASGGRAGFYTGGITDVEPSLDDIGHGSDALMARTRLMSPGAQATTSTGLNYLLAEDNDNMRIPFAKGKLAKEALDKGRRGFMKAAGAAGAGIAALKTGLLGFGEKAAPVAKEVVEVAQSVPPYFLKLVEKIKNFGTDVTEVLAYKDRQKVTKYKDFELTEDVVTGEQTIQRMKVLDDDSASYYGQPLTEETYMSYKPGKGQMDETMKGKTPPDEYEEGTALLRSDREYAGEVVEESAGISDDIFEEIGEEIPEAIRKTKADGGRIGFGKGDIVTKGIPALIKAGEGKFTKAQYLIERIKNTIKGNPDDKYVQETFPNFIKELEANPDLAKNENVFKELGGDLPEGQKIVVYGDDTLDFFTESSGPQNIKKIDMFMEKHGLSRDKALEIMKMEPDDQVMELTKTKFLRQKRTDNADGGRIGMLAGGGILKTILKNSAENKGMTVRDFIMAMNPNSIPSNIKNLISKVDLEQLKAGYREYYENIADMMKTRFDFQKNVEGGKTTPAKELFESMEKTMDKQSFVPKTVTQDDIAKTELMIKNKFNKGRKDNAQGGLQTMLGE